MTASADRPQRMSEASSPPQAGRTSDASRHARAQARLDDWRAEAAGVERDAGFMKWILRVGLPASLAALWWSAGIFAVAAAIVLLAWCMGQYMVRVRRAEFAQHVRDAEAELGRLREAEGRAGTGESPR